MSIKKKAGEGKEGNACRKPMDFENPVCQRMGLLISWASRTLLKCMTEERKDAFKACLQEALTFFAK